jgi:hypothetical protein
LAVKKNKIKSKKPAHNEAVYLKEQIQQGTFEWAVNHIIYSRGIITSRNIEKACRENIIVKALAEDSEPFYHSLVMCN